MNEIKEAATTISRGESFDWEFYLIFLGLIVVGTYLSSFISEYSKKRGSQFATKADIKQIHEQLESATKITESIKNDIANEAWRSRELEVLKRQKIEQYLLSIYESTEFLSQKMYNKLFYENNNCNELAMPTSAMLQKLYIPEIELEHANYHQAYAKFIVWISEGKLEMTQAQKVGEPRVVASAEHMDKYKSKLDHVTETQRDIEMKIKTIAAGLNNA